MDFTRNEEQQAIAELAAKVLADQVTIERLRELEREPDGLVFDRALWSVLSDAGLLGVSVPEEHGGLGLGLVELCLLLEEVGRTVAPVPVLASLAYGGLAVAHFGTDAQRAELLPGVADGSVVLTAALVEALGDPHRPTTTATRQGDGWALEGDKSCVPAGLVADRVVVSASTATGEAGLFLVDPADPSVVRQRQDTITWIPEAAMRFAATPAEPLGPLDADGSSVRWLIEHVNVATSAVMIGVAEAALRLTAEYTKTREQFDRPIATFQAVGQRAANAFIDTEAIRLTTLKAAWYLASGRPASKEVAVAKYFASDAGQRVVRAAQHLHGGIGVDRDYPLHRYYVWAKQLELTLGGGSRHLRELGKLLADESVDA
ncbi:MAG: 3-oxocholest-4-en-26-oyl-CoA dehydrogenase beta subunit [Acidimicrobiaceae bacterium]